MKNLMQKVAEGIGKIGKKATLLVLTASILGGCATYSAQSRLPAEPDAGKPAAELDVSKPASEPDADKPSIPGYSEDDKANLISLGNGYFAKTYEAWKALNLITSALVGEVRLVKTDNGYTGEKTGGYLESAELWNKFYDAVCVLADEFKDGIITDIEAQDFLNSTYKKMTEPVWVEE